MKPEDFDSWIKGEKDKGFFDFFLAEIQKKCALKRIAALQQGNTDFEKGEVAALNWVLQQPEKLAEPLH